MNQNNPVSDQIIKRWFNIADGELLVGDVPISDLVEKFGAPLYVLDAKIIREKVAILKAALPWFECFYSIKANPNPTVIRLLKEEGCGMEVASVGEIELALRCGCQSEAILFAGPGKSDNDLQSAIETGIGEIHVESCEEIVRLEKLARTMKHIVNVAIRLNPSEKFRFGAQQMGGKPSAFGIDEERLREIVLYIKGMKYIRLTGLHVFAGTQILDAKIFGCLYRQIGELARRIVALTRQPLLNIDFGGGFGVPYFPGDDFLNTEVLHKVVEPVVNDLRKTDELKHTKLIIEPGRFLTAESGLYVTNVINIKTSRELNFAVLDGGLNHHLSASGQFGQIIKKNFPIVVANKAQATRDHVYDLVGPLCTPLDTLGRRVSLPKLEVGDHIAFLQSGAYARTSSPHGFLSHPSPMEVLVDEGKGKVIRERGTFADLIRGTELSGEDYSVEPDSKHSTPY